MSTSFPTALDNFTNPAPTSPRSDHAAQHANANDAIEAIEALLGITGSTDPASVTKRLSVIEQAIAGIGTMPKTLWASGALFWIPAGDGGANGLIFSGGGTGNFTLSAAVVTGFTVPQGWIYLTANAGGLSNPAGWYYFTMSDDTHGKIYTTTYDSTSGVVPVFPASPVEMAFTSATRLTSTTSEIQIFQIPMNFAALMGINGSIEVLESMYANILASTKNLRIRAGSYLLHELSPTTSPQSEAQVVITNAGALAKQFITRWAASVGNAPAPTLSNNFRAANLASETTLNFSLKTTALTDHVAGVVRKVACTYGG